MKLVLYGHKEIRFSYYTMYRSIINWISLTSSEISNYGNSAKLFYFAMLIYASIEISNFQVKQRIIDVDTKNSLGM